MKSIEQLEKQLEKEQLLIEKHKKNAADIKKSIELQKGELTLKAVNSLNFSNKEYKEFLKLLKKDKRTVLEAIELARQEGKAERIESRGNSSGELEEKDEKVDQ